jgi:hypothetical protein
VPMTIMVLEDRDHPRWHQISLRGGGLCPK